MKRDIDRLMKKLGIDAIYVEGKSSKDATMYYLLNGVNIYGRYVKKRGSRPFVIHSAIEREVARETGYRLVSLDSFNTREIFGRQRDRVKASAVFMKVMLERLNVRGDVAFYGGATLGAGYNIMKKLVRIKDDITVHYDESKDIITAARETKDDTEVKRIQNVGRTVKRAFRRMTEAVQSMKVVRGVIMKDKKRKLLLGDLRSILSSSLYQGNAISTSGMIVAQGRDAGVPHNSGRDREVVKLGKSIVFDIFPQEIGGGYYFDFTRTLCFGHASRQLKKLYSTVRDAQDFVFSKLKVGRRTVEIEKALCSFFEKTGHSTFLSNKKTQVGYCHSLGHGVGLNIHESPTFGLLESNEDRIKPGHVITVEPGLYYPDKGYGVRIEDVVYIDRRGIPVNLTKYPRRLVVEM
jgi:Xaa-Pro aminopeptidase